MATGLNRTNDGCVQVAYGRKALFQISRKRYEEKGYQPSFDSLPSDHEAEAVKERFRQRQDQDPKADAEYPR